MVTIQSTSSKFSVTFDGDQIHGGVEILEYLKMRCTLKFVSSSRQEVIKVAIHMTGDDSGGNTITTDDVFYYTDPTGVLTISMRDWYRWMKDKDVAWAYVTVTSYTTIDGSTVDDTAQPAVAFLEGISYYAVGAPKGKDVDDSDAMLSTVILPPNVIYNPTWCADIIIESNYKTLYPTAIWSGSVTGTLHNQVGVKGNTRTLTLSDGGDVIRTWDLKDLPTCQDVLTVQWTSLTGAVRMHHFPIVGFIRGNGDKVELDAVHDGYEVMKANFTAVRCRITGLTQWGYYYYMDLIQASDAKAFISSYPVPEDLQPVFIEGESAETPSGPGFFNFEFVANLKQFAI